VSFEVIRELERSILYSSIQFQKSSSIVTNRFTRMLLMIFKFSSLNFN